MIIHPHIPKRKKRKPNAKVRELQSSWQDLLKKYETKNKAPVMVIKRTDSNFVPRPGSDVRHIPSLDTSVGVAPKKQAPVYTGDAMLGVATMHKSNSVPVFKVEDAKAISQMRRN